MGKLGKLFSLENFEMYFLQRFLKSWNSKFKFNILAKEQGTVTGNTYYTSSKIYKWRRDRLGVWDWHVHTAIFKIDNQQGPTV